MEKRGELWEVSYASATGEVGVKRKNISRANATSKIIRGMWRSATASEMTSQNARSHPTVVIVKEIRCENLP